MTDNYASTPLQAMYRFPQVRYEIVGAAAVVLPNTLRYQAIPY